MFCTVRLRRRIRLTALGVLLAAAVLVPVLSKVWAAGEEAQRDFIKWVDFRVTASALGRAYEYDRDTYGEEVHLDWIELLAYAAAKTGGEFAGTKGEGYIDEAAKRLQNGEEMEALTEGLQYYGYYLEAYRAVLGGMVGE